MKMTTDIPASITTPDHVDTRLGTLNFFDGFPDDATVQKVYDNLDFQRGVQAFLTAMPGASVYAYQTLTANGDHFERNSAVNWTARRAPRTTTCVSLTAQRADREAPFP